MKIEYVIISSLQTNDNGEDYTAYGIEAINEEDEVVLRLANISRYKQDVEYLIHRFNQIVVPNPLK